MKRILMVAALLFCAVAARADTSTTTTPSPLPPSLTQQSSAAGVAIDTATPTAVLSLADGLHPLDNAMPATFRDNINGEWLFGATTAIYKKYYISADTGWATPLENSQHGLYLVGGRIYIGQLLVDKIPQLNTLPHASLVTQSLVKYVTAGVWGARDFGYAKWRAGEYVGVEIKLDYLNWLDANVKGM
jgi:hypothetical protein